MTSKALNRIGVFSHKLLDAIASLAVSYVMASDKKTLLFKHAQAALKTLGIDEGLDTAFTFKQLKKCDVNKGKAKATKAKVNSLKSGKGKSREVNLDAFLNMRFSFEGDCIYLQKAPFVKMLRAVVAPHTKGGQIKFSKKALAILQLAFERQLLYLISGSIGVAAAAGKKGPDDKDVKVSEFIGTSKMIKKGEHFA